MYDLTAKRVDGAAWAAHTTAAIVESERTGLRIDAIVTDMGSQNLKGLRVMGFSSLANNMINSVSFAVNVPEFS